MLQFQVPQATSAAILGNHPACKFGFMFTSVPAIRTSAGAALSNKSMGAATYRAIVRVHESFRGGGRLQQLQAFHHPSTSDSLGLSIRISKTFALNLVDYFSRGECPCRRDTTRIHSTVDDETCASAVQGDKEKSEVREGRHGRLPLDTCGNPIELLGARVAKPVKSKTLECMLLRWLTSRRPTISPPDGSVRSDCSEASEQCNNADIPVVGVQDDEDVAMPKMFTAAGRRLRRATTSLTTFPMLR
ncbi:hypothetical protein V8F33_003799 [Rhypophila sp. PSN 637]